MKKILKRLLFGSGIQQKPIRFGIAKGLKMKISFEHKLQRYLGLDEREIQPMFRKFAGSSSIFVDIGASDGYYGLIYHKLNKKGQIFLCDADAAYANVQKDNFRLNEYPVNNVNIISKFIADYRDENHVVLDDLIKNVQETVFLKIDVDGGELHVLKGIGETLQKNDCKIIVETHAKELEESCTEYLQQMGYSTRIIPNAWWRIFIPEMRPIPHNRWFSAEKKNFKN